MPCGAILTFDLETDAAVRRLWQAIEDAGLPSTMLKVNYPPHLTLSVCEDMELEPLVQRLPEFIAAFPPLTVGFSGLGVFSAVEPVVYLSVTRSPDLTALHSAFWELVEPVSKGLSPYYNPRAWVPHVTLNQGMPLNMTGAVVDTLLNSPRPASGALMEIHIVDFDNGLQKNYSARMGSIV